MLLVIMQDAIEHADDLFGSIGAPIGIGAFVLAVLKLGISAADKRASVCEADRTRCTTALEVALTTNRMGNDEFRKMMDDDKRHTDGRFDNLDRAVAEIFLHVRRGP